MRKPKASLFVVPSRPQLVKVSHVLERSQVDRLDRLAATAALSRSDVLRQLLERALADAA